VRIPFLKGIHEKASALSRSFPEKQKGGESVKAGLSVKSCQKAQPSAAGFYKPDGGVQPVLCNISICGAEGNRNLRGCAGLLFMFPGKFLFSAQLERLSSLLLP